MTTVFKRKANWTGRILRRICLLHDIFRGHMDEVPGHRGRRRRRVEPVDDFKGERRSKGQGKVDEEIYRPSSRTSHNTILPLSLALLLTPLVCASMDDACSYLEKVVDCSGKDLERNYGNDSESEWSWSEKMLHAKEVDFSRNKIYRVFAFPELQQLERLDLSHNRIQEIDDSAFLLLQNLIHLDLGENLLTSKQLKPDVFKGVYMAEKYLPLKSLKILRLRTNELYTLDPDVFEHIDQLEELDISKNAFSLLDPNTVTAITSLGLLKKLDLSYNELSTLPEALLHTPKDLDGLLLSGNKFACPPEELKNSHQLKQLSLDNNPIVALNSSCSFPEALEHLTILSLSDMPLLERVDAKAMETLKALQVLELSHNPRLSKIHGEFPSTLQEIYLNENNLSRLEGAQVLGRLDQLHTLDIRANPWECDCESQWLLDVIVPLINHSHPFYLDAISCHSPPEMVGRTLASLELRHYHMRCLDADGNHPERDAAMLTGVLVGLLLGLVATGCVVALYRRGLLPAWTRCDTGPAAFSRGFYSKAGTNNEEF